MVIKFSNITHKYIPSCCKFVKRQANSARQEIVGGKNYYRSNLKEGWQVGKRLAAQQKQNPFRALYTKVFSSLTKAKVRRKDIPAILGTVGLVSPIPAASVLGFAIGKVITKIFSRFK